MFRPTYAYVTISDVVLISMLILTFAFQAVQRDMKDYIAKNSERIIPVGYSAADVRDILMDTVNYMSCELPNATSSRSDLFGVNSYSWCGSSSYNSSGYNVLTDAFSNASLAVFFSEYGCNAVLPRTWSEVEALYGEEMTELFSGGLVYEYSQESNAYGLVALDDDQVTLLEDYENLQSEYRTLDMHRLETSTVAQVNVEKCTPDLITTSSFLKSFELPDRPAKVQEMIDHGYAKDMSGTLVPIESTTIPETVLRSNGTAVQGIRMSVLVGSNSPAGGIPASQDYPGGSLNMTQRPSGNGNVSSSAGITRVPLLLLAVIGSALIAMKAVL